MCFNKNWIKTVFMNYYVKTRCRGGWKIVKNGSRNMGTFFYICIYLYMYYIHYASMYKRVFITLNICFSGLKFLLISCEGTYHTFDIYKLYKLLNKQFCKEKYVFIISWVLLNNTNNLWKLLYLFDFSWNVVFKVQKS